MKKTVPFILAIVLCFAFRMFGQQTANIVVDGPNETDYVTNTLYPATVLLYSQDDEGSMRMRCTATAIEKNAKGYVFVTAAHCACEDDEDQKTVSPQKTAFYITADEPNDKDFIRATPIGCGYRHAGDDFALFQVDADKNFPVIPLGTDPQVMEPVINVASPLGLGKQVFTGSVSSAKLDRPVVEDDINWTNATLLQLFGTDGGSSGSSVISLKQRAICGFVVGTVDKSSVVAIPVSRLIKFRTALAAGTYKHWQPDADATVAKDKDSK